MGKIREIIYFYILKEVIYLRKKFSYIALLLTFILLCSCSQKKQPKEEGKEKEAAESFNSKIAINLINNYMIYLMNDDMENAKKLYSKEITEKNIEIMGSELKVEGYKLDDVNEVGSSALIKVRVARSVREKSTGVLDIYTIKIVKEDGDYKIKEVNSMNEKEGFEQDFAIRMRQKNNVKTYLILDMDGIPQYAFPKNDKVNVSKIKVPKKEYGNIAFSYSGDKLAICTYDKNSFIGVVKIDESLAVQGGATGGEQGGGAGGGGEGKQGGQQGQTPGSKSKEMPIGKELVSLDLLRDCKVQYTSFSLDEKFIMAQYKKENIGYGMRIYNVDSGETIPISIEEQFPIEKFDVIFYSYDTDVINFDVREKKGATKEDMERVGRWQINFKEFKLKKL